jgi:lipid A Kdo2 1-phosphate O-methyltransferase
MALIEELERQGNFLFRWRSYVPSVIVLLSLFFVSSNQYPDGSYEKHLGYAGFCMLFSFLGLFIRCITIGYAPEKTSGRNTKKQVAETLNQTGIYSLIRHPLYVGNFFMFLGIILFVRSLSLTIIFTLFYWMYYERIMFTEEQFLRHKFGPKYQQWADKTPAIIPRFYMSFQKPNLVFSFRNILKREYPSLFGIFIMFLLYDLIFVYFNEPQLRTNGILGIIKPIHIYVFCASVAFYVIVRIIVKFTKFLEVEGR